MVRYCEATHQTRRWKTRQVMVGNVGVGGDNPVRIQSMTTSNTRDAEATAEQVMRLADAGCEIVRVTVQGKKEAEACEEIKNLLIQKGYTTPLVADIHFYPPAALHVADFVDKVRVNPGNFVDKRASFQTLEYDDESYAAELVRIDTKFSPLVLKCKQLGRAIRIGANHGSLSDRIMNRYGDTPAGMVESALEFARVCRQHDFHDIIFSMKSSNPQVMVQAYRLLVAQMMEMGWSYPLHLGVTEAGEGEDGRIKSAMGIGTLLLDGLGDTVRVSLTEDPWHEVDPCQRLVRLGEQYLGRGVEPFVESARPGTAIMPRHAIIPSMAPLHRDGSVMVRVMAEQVTAEGFFESLGCKSELGRPRLTRTCTDALVVEGEVEDTTPLRRLIDAGVGVITCQQIEGATPLSTLEGDIEGAVIVTDGDEGRWDKLKSASPAFILWRPSAECRLHASRRFFQWLRDHEVTAPVVYDFDYTCDLNDLVIHVAAEIGALFCDGLGDGICISGQNLTVDSARQLGFSLLQAARKRTFKTDFISCPSCGRTLFNLQEVSARIRQRTGHLPGVKIAIMGCIVNGPGEMADADFGYVGSRPGKVDLYVGKECVERNIDFDDADDRLVALIKSHGRWVEPVEELALA